MKKGFTLMELLVVITIVAVVSIAATLSFSNIDDATNEKELENKYMEIQRAGSLYLDLHSDRLDLFVKDNVATIPLSVLDQEGYITNDLSDPTGGKDISKNYSVQIVIGDNSVETCIVNITSEGTECIANKNGKKGSCCSVNTTIASSETDPAMDIGRDEEAVPNIIADNNTGVTKFDTGRTVNLKLKKLAGANTTAFKYKDKNIQAIRRATVLKGGFVPSDDNTLSPLTTAYNQEIAAGKAKPIYAWYDAGVINIYSEDKNIYLNVDSYYMFGRMFALNDISGLSEFKANNVVTLEEFFASDYSLTSLSALKEWNVDKLQSLRGFVNTPDADVLENKKSGSIRSLEPLANWNVINLRDLTSAFEDQPKLTSLKGLEKWGSKLKNVKTMEWTFAVCNNSILINAMPKLNDISDLKTWDVSKVENMHGTFVNQYSLKSLNGLEQWGSKTSKVKNMNTLFYGNIVLKDISALRTWDVSNVESMSYMFGCTFELADISPLKNWENKVGKVQNFYGMFNIDASMIDKHKKIGKITSVKPLANWNVSGATKIDYMFEDQLKITDFEELSGWGDKLGNGVSAISVFGLSSAAKRNGFACNNKLADLRNSLTWGTRYTNFYLTSDNCSD